MTWQQKSWRFEYRTGKILTFTIIAKVQVSTRTTDLNVLRGGVVSGMLSGHWLPCLSPARLTGGDMRARRERSAGFIRHRKG